MNQNYEEMLKQKTGEELEEISKGVVAFLDSRGVSYADRGAILFSLGFGSIAMVKSQAHKENKDDHFKNILLNIGDLTVRTMLEIIQKNFEDMGDKFKNMGLEGEENDL